MPNTIFMEAGGGATQGLEFWSSVFSNVSVDTTQKPFGYSSIKCNTSSPAVTSTVQKSGILADTGRRISFYVRFANLPLITNFFTIRNAAGTATPIILRQDGGSLDLRTGATALVSAAAVFSLNTWYRITVSYVVTTTTNFTINVYINGGFVLSADQTFGTLSAVGTDTLGFGWSTTANVILNVASIYVDDGVDLADPGNVRVIAKLPNANSTNAFGTAVGANPANRWANTDERPLSETNGWLQAADDQFARPASDITVSSWTRTGGDGSTLFSCIDEATVNDADFITSPNGSTTGSEVKLGSISAPAGDTVSYVWRAWSTGASGAEHGRCDLYEGTTLRHTGTDRTLGRTSANAVTYTENLSTAERTAITDWTNLRLRFIPTTVGATENISVSWAYLTGQGASATNASENYGIENAATGDANLTGATIVARCAWAWAKKSAAVGSGEALYNNGSAVGITLTTSPALYTSITDSSAYPSTAGTVGLRASHGTADTTLYECGMLIAYILDASLAPFNITRLSKSSQVITRRRNLP